MSEHSRDYEKYHEKLNFLLKDHGAEFDETKVDLNTIESLHSKVNDLCRAHGGEPGEMENYTLESLHPKLNQVLRGHGIQYDDSHLDKSSIEAVDTKLDLLIDAHHK
ncbi:hypothetical protein [Jeotgalicoccus sp. WY2]|uniref:hypothetical protein n=1 Tax=Jeotgalicoccus sp. WY2 TaxID=2708346 RepID=UPI001BD333D5|nr:hypothetical protein [Jeotgalicoccus sp. WY2]